MAPRQSRADRLMRRKAKILARDAPTRIRASISFPPFRDSARRFLGRERASAILGLTRAASKADHRGGRARGGGLPDPRSARRHAAGHGAKLASPAPSSLAGRWRHDGERVVHADGSPTFLARGSRSRAILKRRRSARLSRRPGRAAFSAIRTSSTRRWTPSRAFEPQ